MFEALLALGILLAIAAMGFLATIPLEVGLRWSTILTIAGFTIGVPPAVIYHILLFRALSRRGPVAKSWIWRPFDHHETLPRVVQQRLWPWAAAGGLGFVVIVAGLAVAIGGLVNAWLTLGS
jgi:hypothetical protein